MWSSAEDRELCGILVDLLRIDSSNPPGREKAVTDYIAALLKKEGIESRILEKEEGRTNLWAKLPGGAGEPILLLSHIDVVPADPAEWKHPPFEAVNDNGTIYARGALDTKHLTAIELMTMLLLKREGIPLERPVILVATADEEAGSSYGMGFLSAEHPELFPDGYVVSEGGGFVLTQDKKSYRTITCGEKGRCEMTLTVEKDARAPFFDPMGSAAGKLLDAMLRLSEYEAPEQPSAPARRFGEAVPGELTDPTIRNLWQYSTKSCLAIDGYERRFEEDASSAELGVSYQFLPGTTQKETEALMDDLLAGSDAVYSVKTWSEGYECDMDNPFYHLLDEVSRRHDPCTTLLPILALGRTDGRFIRRNVYGYSPMLGDLPFSQVLKKVHQKDECITEDSLVFGGRVIYEAVRSAAARTIGTEGGKRT